ncbi:hypothetical protein [Croceibacterium xixiisoli]|uniref:hypothetical protein n=1 Tax=Croceibacterium xixiisoli TaxID=1476466 RepID=UPI001367F14B|nr:hypothetical protein [Croceibacterium xixiisoli]
MGSPANLRWRTLNDYRRQQANLAATCGKCRRTAILDINKLIHWFFLQQWNDAIPVVERRLYCVKCRRRPSDLKPTTQAPDHLPFFPRNDMEWRSVIRRLRD